MSEPAFGTVSPSAPAGENWVTSLWQEMFTADTTSMLDGTVSVTNIEQPALWQFVRQIALESGLTTPDALRVVGNAHVTTHEEPYILDIGVPMLLALDQGDLAEVVTRVMTERDHGARPAAEEPSGKSRGGLFSRLRGGTQDEPARATRPSGTQKLESAIHEATQWWIDEFVHPDLTDNLVPRPVYLGLAELLAERGMEIADAAELEARPDIPGNPAASDPALFLLSDADALFENVADAGLPPGTGELEWEDAMARWTNRRSRASSIILFRSASPTVSTLWELLDLVEQGHLRSRVANALRSDAVTVEDCVFLLTGVLCDALADVGAGMLTCSWGGVMDLVSETEGPLDLAGVARQVVLDPTVVPFLRDILREYQVAPTWSPTDDGTGDDRALKAFLAAPGERQAPGTGFLTRL
ncbi:hypothetical protein [Nocardioides yefusunii]|uniref:Uncharacterized protein n=1 Tax=Nocardioides yefusunii TaxID=2500546 RepID=A0ABW1QVT3_9ACTN|nr:hypothetical protein [Nocardioides yefusunii]